MKTKWLALTVLACGVLAPSSHAEDWTQFRGPKRDGVSQERGLLKTWPQGGPKLLWQNKEAGYGFGSLAVAGNRVYLVGNEGLENEFVRALDVKDGKPVWTTKIGKVGNPDQQPNYPGARSTPTLDGKRLYALGSDGDLVCLETATGKLVWKKSLRADFGGKPGVWAYSESPLVDGDLVVVSPGGEKATILALNKNTGAVAWQSAMPTGDLAGYASAIPMEVGGSKQYVQYLSKGLTGVDAKTGKLLWRFDKSIDTRFAVHASTPIAYGDTVYSAAATGGGVARIKESNGGYVAEAVYVERKVPNALGGAIKSGGFLYGSSTAVLLCLDYATGRVCWEERSVGASSVCLADGHLYVHGENGEVALVEATSEGYREKGRFTPANGPERGQSKAWAYPVVANGRLYIRDLGSLWVYDIKGSNPRL